MSDWVVLELTSKSEGEHPDLLQRAIRSALKDPKAEIFVPACVAQVGEDQVIHYLVDGYVFVRYKPGSDSAYLRLEGSKFVQSVLTEAFGKNRRLARVENSAIDKMRIQIQQEVDQGIAIGDTVRIVSGPYRNITAQVIEDISEKKVVQVYVKLLSKQTIVTLPRSFLQIVDRTPLSSFFRRLSELRRWCRLVQPVFEWSDRTVRLAAKAWRKNVKCSELVRRFLPLQTFINYLLSSPAQESKVLALRTSFDRVVGLAVFYKRLKHLGVFVKSCHQDPLKSKRDLVRRKFDALCRLSGLVQRLQQHERAIEGLAHWTAKRKRDGQVTIQNVLVDGFNLAFRCFFAPGISDLRDAKGRPTGMVLGFLRTLGSLKKRYPESRVYVAWDGSSQRRRALFSEYKANRIGRTNDSSTIFQISFLKESLSKLGVWQAENPKEEADDVLASLVWNNLKSQHNLIYSSDRDLVALVTDTTFVLAPGSGARKEILYDPSMVRKVFGVPVECLSQFRALCGDASDNIPGVPRVPKKVLKALIQTNGSIDKIYTSGLTGLSKGQYERLRIAEPQVRLNVKLMALVDVPVFVTDVNPDVEGAVGLLQSIGITPGPIVELFKS